MNINKLAEKLADLSFDGGHVFENGTPFRETLGYERAKGLFKALQDRGYDLSSSRGASPSICGIEHAESDAVH